MQTSVVCFFLMLLGHLFALAGETLPHESPWTGGSGTSSNHQEIKWRKWMEATVFPEFEFTGSLEDAIEHLMVQSKKVTPDGRMVGGFVLRGEFDKIRVNIKLRGRNALEIIDSMCALANATWTLAPHSIIIQRDAKPPTR
ncbi:hypothetical protein [Prosthecobacter sp.]|uniref:hypothetical protein n=1 Tax=Prosthecobacter sp. TaxID=1965333 RepID=UPI002ABCDEAB|nr:hypothetical protein [Prosthecobacter sp.]MDZ4402103.1 hypothetical protein [Prosthecobacter sp.]